MKPYVILLAFVILSSCAESTESVGGDTQTNNSKYHASKELVHKYVLIRDNLYHDNNGNLFLRSFNNEGAENGKEKYEVWLHTVYCDTCWTPSNDGWKDITELRDFVDTATFHLDTTDLKEGIDIYKDKNYSYRHKWMADGGTISVH
jgi:hypothetical protein